MTRKAALKVDNKLSEVFTYDSITVGKYYKLVIEGDTIRCYSGSQLLEKSPDLVSIWIQTQILYEVIEKNAF